MKINVGLNKKVGRKTIHKNVSINIDGKWGEGRIHKSIKDTIKKEYPEWNITGYALWGQED